MNQIIARSILITFLASIHNKIKIPKSQRLRSKLVQLQKGSAVQRWNQSSKNTKYYSLNVHGLLITRKSQIFFCLFWSIYHTSIATNYPVSSFGSVLLLFSLFTSFYPKKCTQTQYYLLELSCLDLLGVGFFYICYYSFHSYL